MNPGKLDKRITIQKLTSSVNENGFPEEVWSDYKKVWSSMENLNGREYFAAKAVQSETSVNLTIRYLRDIDATVNVEGAKTTEFFRIKVGNLVFDIDFINDVKYGRRWMDIKALAVK